MIQILWKDQYTNRLILKCKPYMAQKLRQFGKVEVYEGYSLEATHILTVFDDISFIGVIEWIQLRKGFQP